MLNLLNFFEETTGTEGDSTSSNVITWVIFGVMLVGLVLMTVIPQRKQRKQMEEMMSKLAIGAIVTTIGGIIGEVVKLDEQNIWLATGTEDNKSVMQFLRQAIHSVAPAPGSAEAKAEAKQAENDEIK